MRLRFWRRGSGTQPEVLSLDALIGRSFRLGGFAVALLVSLSVVIMLLAMGVVPPSQHRYLDAQSQAASLHSDVVTEREALRDYVITHSSGDTTTALAAEQEIGPTEQALHSTVQGTDLSSKVDALMESISTWQQSWDALRRSGRISVPASTVDSVFVQERGLFAPIISAEDSLMVAIDNHLAHSDELRTALLVGSASLEFVIVFIIAVFIWHRQRQLRRQTVAPVRTLIAEMRHIQEGNLEAEITTPEGFQELREVATGVAAMTASLARLQRRTREEGFTDALTRLYNRARFDTDLASEFERCHRYGHPLSVIMVDVDHFKLLNDTHGHPMGDEVLRSVAATLRRSARLSDGVYRYGGEEFVLVLPETGLPAARRLAERVREQIERDVAAELPVGIVTASLGVAAMDSETATPVELVEAADAALYDAKASGRNRVSVNA